MFLVKLSLGDRIAAERGHGSPRRRLISP